MRKQGVEYLRKQKLNKSFSKFLHWRKWTQLSYLQIFLNRTTVQHLRVHCIIRQVTCRLIQESWLSYKLTTGPRDWALRLNSSSANHQPAISPLWPIRGRDSQNYCWPPPRIPPTVASCLLLPVKIGSIVQPSQPAVSLSWPGVSRDNRGTVHSRLAFSQQRDNSHLSRKVTLENILKIYLIILETIVAWGTLLKHIDYFTFTYTVKLILVINVFQKCLDFLKFG